MKFERMTITRSGKDAEQLEEVSRTSRFGNVFDSFELS